MPHWQRQHEADDSDRLELSLKQDLNVHLKFTLKPFDSTRRGTVTIASGSSTAEPQAVPLYKLADPVADWRCFRTVAATGRGGGVISTALPLVQVYSLPVVTRTTGKLVPVAASS